MLFIQRRNIRNIFLKSTNILSVNVIKHLHITFEKANLFYSREVV